MLCEILKPLLIITGKKISSYDLRITNLQDSLDFFDQEHGKLPEANRLFLFISGHSKQSSSAISPSSHH